MENKGKSESKRTYQMSSSQEESDFDNETSNLATRAVSDTSGLKKQVLNIFLNNIYFVGGVVFLLILVGFVLQSIYITNYEKDTSSQSLKMNALDEAMVNLKEQMNNNEKILSNLTKLQTQITYTQYELLRIIQEVGVAVASLPSNDTTIASPPPVTMNLGVDISCDEKDFYTVAKKYHTDKVTTHSYHLIYQKYLARNRCQKLKVLEIGLGCGMSYGAGASYYVWLEYFPNAEIYFIEYEEECAKAWKDANPRVKVVLGDQADTNFLNRFITEHGGDFDYIIDDGGHMWYQQITSFEVLWKYIKPAGIYFIEDLGTSFSENYDGGHGGPTAVNYIKDILSDVIGINVKPKADSTMSADIRFVDCMLENCAFIKMGSELDNKS